MDILIVLAVIVVIIAIFLIVTYNTLVKMRENVREAFKAISIALEERLRTVGGVIDAAKKYMDFESDVLQKVVQARSGLQNALKSSNTREAAQANDRLQNAFQGLNVQLEAYPDLKASELMANAQASFTQTAQKIASHQNYFNGTVREYNKKIKVFPTVLFASIFGFSEETYYESEQAVQSKVNDADLNRSLNF